MGPGPRWGQQAKANSPVHRAAAPLANGAIAERRREDITQAQYGAWMAERRECPSCASSNVAVDGESFGGLWCLDCRHEWRVTKFPGGTDPEWWTLRG
jgi:hypothetical protein